MPPRPLLLGHRGARNYAPENTMPAFRLALDHGCDGFEFDVRTTSDGVAVICHDPKYKRIEIASRAFVEVREKCVEVPTLEEVLCEFAATAFLNVELKTAGAETTLLQLLRKYPARKGLVVSSFLPEVVKTLRQLGAEFALGLICENARQLRKGLGLPVQALMLERRLVTHKLVDEIRNTAPKPTEGFNGAPTPVQIFVWTVNSVSEMRKFAEMGVDGIISDDTKLMAETLGE
jgi:glycerophosphoryl diester phosphodiesterase